MALLYVRGTHCQSAVGSRTFKCQCTSSERRRRISATCRLVTCQRQTQTNLTCCELDPPVQTTNRFSSSATARARHGAELEFTIHVLKQGCSSSIYVQACLHRAARTARQRWPTLIPRHYEGASPAGRPGPSHFCCEIRTALAVRPTRHACAVSHLAIVDPPPRLRSAA